MEFRTFVRYRFRLTLLMLTVADSEEANDGERAQTGARGVTQHLFASFSMVPGVAKS